MARDCKRMIAPAFLSPLSLSSDCSPLALYHGHACSKCFKRTPMSGLGGGQRWRFATVRPTIPQNHTHQPMFCLPTQCHLLRRMVILSRFRQELISCQCTTTAGRSPTPCSHSKVHI